MTEPTFDDTFWAEVNRRAGAVRRLAVVELAAAEQQVLAEAALDATGESATVVPVFTEPFWTQVGRRALRVRRAALTSIDEAEQRVAGDQEVLVPGTRSHGRLRTLAGNLSLQRSDAFGFVAALLAVVLFVPQLIAPVWSSAGLEPPRILQFVIIRDDKKQQPPALPAGEGGAGQERSAGGRPAAPPTTGGAAGSSASPSAGPNGATGASSDSASGADGGAVTGAPALGAGGSSEAGGAGSGTLEPSPPPLPAPAAPRAPLAPTALEATAVDATSVRLAWGDGSTEETGFQISRIVAEGSAPVIERVARDVVTFTWANLLPETRVCFRVRAINEAGASEWFPGPPPAVQACATTPAVPVEAPVSQPQASPSPAAPTPAASPS
ncbi:MAG: fibronectin type III domain-containing protein [Actinomycetota bacterium]